MGENSLICADVPGLNWVKLTRLTTNSRATNASNGRSGGKLFESYDYRKTGIHQRAGSCRELCRALQGQSPTAHGHDQAAQRRL